MLEYYLKFLFRPLTKKQFRMATRPDSFLWSVATLGRMKDYGWAECVKGKWSITKLGQEVYDDYLGVPIGTTQEMNRV